MKDCHVQKASAMLAYDPVPMQQSIYEARIICRALATWKPVQILHPLGCIVSNFNFRQCCDVATHDVVGG